MRQAKDRFPILATVTPSLGRLPPDPQTPPASSRGGPLLFNENDVFSNIYFRHLENVAKIVEVFQNRDKRLRS